MDAAGFEARDDAERARLGRLLGYRRIGGAPRTECVRHSDSARNVESRIDSIDSIDGIGRPGGSRRRRLTGSTRLASFRLATGATEHPVDGILFLFFAKNEARCVLALGQ